MRRFENNQIVIVTDSKHPMHGKTGRVVRLRYADIAGWVQMDEQPPAWICPFPANDEAGRGKNLLLHPRQCEAA